MGKTFKYGEKKDKKSKIRMKLYNQNKKSKPFSNVENSVVFEESNVGERSDPPSNRETNTFSGNIEHAVVSSGHCEDERYNGNESNAMFPNGMECDEDKNGSSAVDIGEPTAVDIGEPIAHEEMHQDDVADSFVEINANATACQTTANDTMHQNSGLDAQNNAVQSSSEPPNNHEVESSDVTMQAEHSIDNSGDDDYDSDGYCSVSAETRVDGRRIVEMDFFLKQLSDVADHNFGECLFGETYVKKEIKNGLQSKMIFACSNCGKEFPILTNESEKTTETLCINSTAVLASNMIGVGYSQLEQFTSVLNIPTMCADRFKSLNDDIGALWELTAEQSMKEAAEEERQAAIARGDVDEEDGISFISVVTDGCWCKRSYNKNYTSLSGVAAIVGATFGKVLWIGVRNKYCVICVRNKNKNLTPPPHFCTANYSGPSSEMESQSIVQGFQKSVEMYNVRYMKVIADGDSSTYLKILVAKPYQHRIVEKDECCNHLFRNFRKQLDSATTGCPRGLTKHVGNSLERIRKGISCAVKYRYEEETDEHEKISLLKSDINNVVHHVFGDHANCPSYIREFCKEEENHISALKASGTYEKLSIPVRKLMYCAKDLLVGQSNNIAEHYNSIVCMFVGGKRVNFAMSNSFSYKAHAAAVQFNSKKAVTTLYQTAFQRNPPALTQKVELKRLQKATRGKERRTLMKANHIRPKRFNDNKEKGSGYGENCETVDMPADAFESEKKIFLDKLKENQENRSANEENSRTKEKSSLYKKITNAVLLASSFGGVCKGRVLSNQVKDICKKMTCYSKAKRHNDESQPVAIHQLAKQQQISIRDCGVYIDKEHSCLAASPSGVTDDGETVIEIQCPTAIASKDPADPSVLLKLSFMGTNKEGNVGLKKSDDIYYQIQGQLHVLDKKLCLFAIWTSSLYNLYVEEIVRDDEFFKSKMESRLLSFYYDWLLPELIDPRLKRNMAVREPQ